MSGYEKPLPWENRVQYVERGSPEEALKRAGAVEQARRGLKCGRPCPVCKGRVKDGKAGICERQDGHGILHRCGRCGGQFTHEGMVK
jgi:hypothetical protein